MPNPWILVVVGLALAVVIVVIWRRWRFARFLAVRNQAMSEFEGLRARLAAEFLPAAAASGKPRGLCWKSCDLSQGVRFAVDRVSGELYALVGATISFEAIEGGGMEEVEAVGNLRSATAVFVHRGGTWTTDGRVVFNLDPDQTLAHYGDTLEPAET